MNKIETKDRLIQETWKLALADLTKSCGLAVVNSWMSKLSPASNLDGKFVFVSSTSFVCDNVKSRFYNEILSAIQSHDSSVSSIDIVVGSNENDDLNTFGNDLLEGHGNNQSCSFGGSKVFQQDDQYGLSALDPKFTFDTFVVGKPNEFAYAAAKRICESDDAIYNPLFLYGGVGLGKTHLMHAVAWEVRQNFPHKKVIYISAEKFMFLFVRSLRHKDSIAFKEMFRNTDILMIDDVQFICGKNATQEEFFHTFNVLVDNNKQIVLSADKSPVDLEDVEARLKSRMGWGLVADIHPANFELRLGILQTKVQESMAVIPENVLEFLAMKITSNIRELEGALNRIIAHATLIGRNVTIDMAKDVIRDILRSNEKIVTIEAIQRRVCEFYGIKQSEILSSNRKKDITNARHVAMYLSKKMTTNSLPEIGRKFGGKDHATVLHAVKRVNEKMNSDSSIASDIEILMKTLEG